MQVINSEPLSLIYPLEHSNVTMIFSGKTFFRSDSLVRTVLFPPSGLGQSPGSKKKWFKISSHDSHTKHENLIKMIKNVNTNSANIIHNL